MTAPETLHELRLRLAAAKRARQARNQARGMK
jgi:hypothetical protein